MSARPLIEKLKLWPWALIVRLLIGLVGVGIVIAVILQLFVIPGKLRKEAGEAKQDRNQAEATINQMEVGENIMTNRAIVNNESQVITERNEREIRAAPGAETATPPAVHNALVDSVGRLRRQHDDRQR